MSEETKNSEEEKEIKIEIEDGNAEESSEKTADSGRGADPEEKKKDIPEGGEAGAPEKESGKPEKPEKNGHREKKELAKKDAEIAELTDRYKRTLAEYDNFRRRTEKEKSDLYSFAVRDVMTRILPVLDNLERGIAAIPEDQKNDTFAEGMDKIRKQFEKALDDIGVKPIEAKGKKFDPAYHNAVMHIDDEKYGENEVVEEFQKGYTYRDSVVRHSMVKVAN